MRDRDLEVDGGIKCFGIFICSIFHLSQPFANLSTGGYRALTFIVLLILCYIYPDAKIMQPY